MNLYMLTYECWKVWEGGTTSDGYPNMMSDWKKREEPFETESDKNAREQARILLSEAVQSEEKIRLPMLTRVVAIPRVGGVEAHKDSQPWSRYTHYYEDEGVASA